MIRPFEPDKSVLPTEKGLYFVRSSNQIGAIWQYLKRYQSPPTVKKRLKASFPTMSKDLIEKKAIHIADCIRQAEEYFSTASRSDLSIKPLILYYGMLDLVKALMLFGDNNLTLDDATLKAEGLNSHGLTHGTRGSADEKIRDDSKKLLEEFCYTAGTGDTVYSLLHRCWSTVAIAPHTRFTVGDLASMHPASWSSFSQHTNKPPKFMKANSSFRTTARGDEHYLLFAGTFDFWLYGADLKPGKGRQFLEKRLPRLKSLYLPDAQNAYGYYLVGKPGSIQDFQPTYRTFTGERYTMGDADAGVALHPIEVDFLMMFMLGSLTRYAPQKWLKNVQYSSGDAMFVIEGQINSVASSFPKLILEELEGKEYTFTGDVSYWG